jgi:hypothetical protein
MRIRFVSAVAAVAVLSISAGGVAVAQVSGHRSASSAATRLHDRALFAVLDSHNEVGMNHRLGAGDPDGRGSFTATVDGGQLCFGLTVNKIGSPTMAHIHMGGPHTNGPIAVVLTPPSSGNPGASSACVAVAGSVAHGLLLHPHRYYVNVHNAAFPGGAVRGQLFARTR